MQKNNDILKEALYEIKKEELDALPAETEIEYTFSDKFQKNIRKLIKEQNKTYSSRALRKAIIILIAAVLAMLISLSAVANSDKLLDFIYSIRSDNTLLISYETEKPSDKFEAYTLNFVPEEYVQTTVEIEPKTYSTLIIWETPDKKKYIHFDQNSSSGTLGINTYGNYVEELNINSVVVVYVEQEDHIHCFWKEKGFNFDLVYPKELGKDFIMKNIGLLREIPE